MSFKQSPRNYIKDAIFGSLIGVGTGLILNDAVKLSHDHDVIEKMATALTSNESSPIPSMLFFGAIGAGTAAWYGFNCEFGPKAMIGTTCISLTGLSNLWKHSNCNAHGDFPAWSTSLGIGLIFLTFYKYED